MKSNQNLYIQAFWKPALLCVMTNKNACSTWLPNEEVLRKIRSFNANTINLNVSALNCALNNSGLIGWINGVCSHVPKVLYVAKNRKYIKLANTEMIQAFYYLISVKPIVPIYIPNNNVERCVKYGSIYARSGKSDETVNIYAIATNGFHDELFNDDKETETEEEVGADVLGIKRRYQKQSNNVTVIGPIATAEKN